MNRAPPPPPPAAPPATKKDTYRALYDFAGQSEIELTLSKDEIIEVLKKEGNGTYLLTLSIHTVSTLY
jgi:myosin-1